MSYFQHCSSKLFFLKETIKHPNISREWEACLKVEHFTREQLLALQREKLQRRLRHAATRVPFYRQYAAAHNWDLEHLRVEDFPVITKDIMRGHETEFIADGCDPAKLECCNTSGSTGEPFRFYASPAERTYTYVSFWRGLNRFGLRPGDRRVWVKGIDDAAQLSWSARFRRRLWSIFNRCLLVDAHFLSSHPGRIAEVIRTIEAYNPQYFHGYPASIYDLTRYLDENRLDSRKLFPRLKAVVAESEKLYPEQRALMEKVFRVPVLENYGSVEFGMIAQPDANGVMALNEDHVYAESDIDGEAVLTNLDSDAFAFIRFKNGDRIALGEGSTGLLPFRKVNEILGRVTEKIKLPNGGSLQAFAVTSYVYDLADWIRVYQFYQADLNHLVLKIVPAKDRLPAEIEQKISSEVRRVTDGLLDFKIEYVEQIPLTKRGKRLFVVSQA